MIAYVNVGELIFEYLSGRFAAWLLCVRFVCSSAWKLISKINKLWTWQDWTLQVLCLKKGFLFLMFHFDTLVNESFPGRDDLQRTSERVIPACSSECVGGSPWWRQARCSDEDLSGWMFSRFRVFLGLLKVAAQQAQHLSAGSEATPNPTAKQI